MLKGVVFDLFGTLAHLGRDSQPYRRLAVSACPGRLVEILRASLVVSADDLRAFAARVGIDPPGDLEQLQSDLAQDVASILLFPDARETLIELKRSGLKLGLISNLAKPYKEAIALHGLADFFDGMLFSCDVGLRKPDPALYRRVSSILGLAPEALVMVGDRRRSDYDGPIASGMRAILLQRQGASQAVPSISSLIDLPAWIRRNHKPTVQEPANLHELTPNP